MPVSTRLNIFALAAIVFMGCVSCKKDSAPARSTAFDVQYRIMNAHHSITSISYVSANGDTLAGDPADQSDTLWSKIITVSKPPFAAGMKAVMNNTSTTSIHVLLQIAVEGTIFNQVERSIPPGVSTDASVVFDVD